jgi:hypothetical protein
MLDAKKRMIDAKKRMLDAKKRMRDYIWSVLTHFESTANVGVFSSCGTMRKRHLAFLP